VRWWRWILVAVLAAIVGFVLMRGLERLVREPAGGEEVSHLVPGAPLRTVQIFFGAKDRVGFVTEERAIADPPSLEKLAEEIVRQLLEGSTEGITGLPPSTRLRAFYIAEDGVAYLDLSSDLLLNWPVGDGLEWVTLGSLVRSLTENIPTLRAVQIMIDGHMVARSPGSIPLDLPLDPEWFGATSVEVMR